MEKLHHGPINASKRHLLAEINLDFLPKTTNHLNTMHWAMKHKEAKACKLMVMLQCRHKRIHGLGLSRVELELTRFSSKEPDFDGMVGSWKYVIDALVEASVIVDDKPSIIGSPIFLWEKAKQKEGKIRIRIYTESK
jgi:hypothetical protein